MRRIIILLFLLFSFTGTIFAQTQNTTVTGTIVGNDGSIWQNATVSAVATPPNALPLSTTTSTSGAFTLVLPSALSGGTLYQFQVSTQGILPTKGTGPQSFQTNILISGTSQSVSSALSVLAPALLSPSGGSANSSATNPVLINQSIDNFNRTGANLGANWTNYQNGWVPNSGAAHGTAGSGGSNVAAYTAVTPGSSATERCRVVVTSFGAADSVGCALRVGGTAGTSANYYACFEQTTGPAFDIVKVVGGTSASNGTVTVIATNTTTASTNGDFLDFKVVGNTLTCNLDYNKLIIQGNDSSSPLTSGFPGLYEGISASTSSAFLADDFVIPATATANIIVDGDSIANGDGPTGSASYSNSFSNYLLLSGAGTQPYVRNVAVDLKALGVGIAAINTGTIETMLATGTSVVDTMFVSGIPNLVVLWACTNDIANGGRTAAQCITDTTTYVTARHAAGWKVVVVPALSRNIAGDPNLQILNQSLNTVGADGVVVLSQALTNTSSFGNQALFQTDGIHPTILASEGPIARGVSASINQIPGF